jgi:HD domain
MPLATDLGIGQPMDHLLRSCVLGLRLSESLGLDESERAVVYYVALLAWLGCHSDAHEQAAWFGDDIALKADTYGTDMVGLSMATFMLRHVGNGSPPLRRARLAASFGVSGREAHESMDMSHCLIAGQFAVRLGLGDGVRDALQHVFERWDGRGEPRKLKGEEIALSARIVVLADMVEAYRRMGGVEAAVDVAERRRGGQFDPGLVDHLTANAAGLLEGLDAAGRWDEVIATEPALAALLTEPEFDSALEAIADFADLKSPYTTGTRAALPTLRRRRAACWAWGRRSSRGCAAPGWCTILAGSGSRTRSGTSEAASPSRR